MHAWLDPLYEGEEKISFPEEEKRMEEHFENLPGDECDSALTGDEGLEIDRSNLAVAQSFKADCTGVKLARTGIDERFVEARSGVDRAF